MSLKVGEDVAQGKGKEVKTALSKFMLTKDELKDVRKYNFIVLDSKIATLKQLEAIQKGLGSEDAEFKNQSIAFSLECASKGTSSLTVFNSELHFVDGSVDADEMATEIKKVCTIRQFCAAWARYVFDHFLRSGKPPSGWANRGFTQETAYASFDFFHGVTSEASVPMIEPMLRGPTDEEIGASNLNARFTIMNAQRQRGRGGLSNAAEMGLIAQMSGGGPKLQLLED